VGKQKQKEEIPPDFRQTLNGSFQNFGKTKLMFMNSRF
jgi:hypothetical protein